jgi:SMI1 / KNR4 family (SUKH-1)
MEPLSQDLIDRIRQRASNPDTRNDLPPSVRGKAVQTKWVSVAPINLGGRPQEINSSTDALASPAADAAVADAETKLGFRLPDPLRQLYTQIANGGFGPYSGLLPLQDVVTTYLSLREDPPGPRGQKWPEELLPLTSDDAGHCCINRNSGALVFWDIEELASGGSDKVWKKSFKAEAPDLSAWLEKWLGRPSPEQKTKDLIQQGMNSALKQSLEYWRSKSPEERAKYGLPETGWEEKLFGHLGIDLTKL